MQMDNLTTIHDRKNREFHFIEFMAPDFLKCGMIKTIGGEHH